MSRGMYGRVSKLLLVGAAPIALLLMAAVYFYHVYALAKNSDIDGLVLASLLRDRLVDFRVPAGHSTFKGERNGGIPLAAVGYGSSGACSYHLLEKCIAIKVGVEIEERPALYFQLIRALRNPCEILFGTVGPKDQVYHFDRISRRFGCGSQGASDNDKDKIVLSIVQGIDQLPEKTMLPGGGVRYAQRDPRVLYQVVVIPHQPVSTNRDRRSD